MGKPNGVTGSDSAMSDFIDLLSQTVKPGGDADSIRQNAENAVYDPADPKSSPQFGIFAEADQLYNKVNDVAVKLWLGTWTLQNALQDLHDGTKEIQKNYSDANNNLDYVAQNLTNYTDYLNSYSSNRSGGS